MYGGINHVALIYKYKTSWAAAYASVLYKRTEFTSLILPVSKDTTGHSPTKRQQWNCNVSLKHSDLDSDDSYLVLRGVSLECYPPPYYSTYFDNLGILFWQAHLKVGMASVIIRSVSKRLSFSCGGDNWLHKPISKQYIFIFSCSWESRERGEGEQSSLKKM